MIFRRPQLRSFIGWCLSTGWPVPKYKLTKQQQDMLKIKITMRICTENYTCRLPRPAKPRVRYKLTPHLVRRQTRFFHWYEQVWK